MPRFKLCHLIRVLSLGLLACFLSISCGLQTQNLGITSVAAKPVGITLSAAASLQDALQSIAPLLRQRYPELTVNYNFGASGALQRQIEQGAPADLFFAAATKPMDALAQNGLLLPNSRRNLLTNHLVLIAPKTSSLRITNLSQLRNLPIRRLAVGEFRSVPAGQYAEQVFRKLGLLNSLQSKFVFGNSVRNVLAAVETGNVDVGVVYATDAALSQKVKVLIAIPTDLHEPILYPIAVLKRSSNPQAAQSILEFLTTNAAQTIFRRYGFRTL